MRREYYLSSGLPGGGSRVQAEVAEPREQTHPELVKHGHLLVAGQVGQDLRLGDDRGLETVLVLVKVV